MITQTIPITARIREIRDGKIYTSCGERRDCYNSRYYRPAPQVQHEIRRRAPDKKETFANLLELAMLTKVYQARHVYSRQYLSMVGRRLLPGREVNSP